MKAICLPRRNRSSVWAFCSSKLTFFLKWESGWSYSKKKQFSRPTFRNSDQYPQLFARTSIRPLNRPSPTSLIHNTASEGKSEQELTWVLNLIFQHEKVEDVGNFSNWSSDRYLQSLLYGHRILCIFRWWERLMVFGLPANIGIGIVLRIRSSPIATCLPVLLYEEFLDEVSVMNRT